MEKFDLILPLSGLLHSLDRLLSTSKVLDTSRTFPLIKNNSLSGIRVVDLGFECALTLVLLKFHINCGAIGIGFDLFHVFAKLKQVIALVSSLRHQIFAPQFYLGRRVIRALICNRSCLLIIDVHGGTCSGCSSWKLISRWTLISRIFLWLRTLESPNLWAERAVSHLF